MESPTLHDNGQQPNSTKATSRKAKSISPATDSGDDDDTSVKKLAEKHRKPVAKVRDQKPTRRASKKAILQLHSESQRLLREAPVNLPYHVPEKLTLYEFLKKRNSKLLANWPNPPGSVSAKSGAAPAGSGSGSAADDSVNPRAASQPLSKPVKPATSSDCKAPTETGVSQPVATAIGDDDDLPDMNTAWKQCTSDRNPVDSRPAVPTTSTAMPSTSKTVDASCSAADTCYSDVTVVAKPKPVKRRLCSGRDYIRSLLPNLPKLAPVVGGKGAGTDLINLDDPYESNEIYNRLVRQLRMRENAARKAAGPPRVIRHDEHGLALFHWRSSDAGLDGKDLPPGAQRAALRQALLDRLHLRRKYETLKRIDAYEQAKQQRSEKDSDGGPEEPEEEECDAEEEEEDECDTDEQDEECEPDDDESADEEDRVDTRGNPFVDDEAEESDQSGDRDSTDDDDDSRSVQLHLETSDEETVNNKHLSRAQRRRKALIVEDDGDDSTPLTSAAAKVENSSFPYSDDGRKSSGARKVVLDGDALHDAAKTPSSSRKANRSFILPVEDSQLLLGQQTCGRSQQPEATQDFRMSLVDATPVSHSESLLIDDEGFLRYKSPKKTSTAAVNRSRRRLELNYIPEGTEATHTRDDGATVEQSPAIKHRPDNVGGFMTAFASGAGQSVSDEAIALCSGGFTGIASSAVTSSIPAADDKCSTADEAALLCSGSFAPRTSSPSTASGKGIVTKPAIATTPAERSSDRRSGSSQANTHRQSTEYRSAQAAATSSDGGAAARKLKRVRLWPTDDAEAEAQPKQIHRRRTEGSTDGGAGLAAGILTETTPGEKRKFQGFLNKRKRKIRRDFVEEEAELSGSEEGSGDEEVALDDSAKELLQQMADADHDDVGTEEELRNQVGRVHMKSLLDADHKEVLRMQERFLPDGDLHSDTKRIRRFRWSNRDYSVFAGSTVDQDDSADEKEKEKEMESEYAWRKERFEREQWLKNNPRPEDDEILYLFSSRTDRKPEVQRLWKAIVAEQRARNLAKAQAPAPSRPVAPDDDPPSPSKIYGMNMKACRGSFLARPKEQLAKLAKIYGGRTINPYGAKRNGHFVFTMVSPTAAKGSKQAQAEEPSTRRKPAFNAFAHKVSQPQVTVDKKEPDYPKDSILAYL